MKSALDRSCFLLLACVLAILLLVSSSLAPAWASDPLDTWNLRSYPAPVAGLNAVASDGSTTVAVGEGGTIITSSDGATWTRRSSPVTTSLYGVTIGGGKVIAVGANGAVLYSSNGGVSWSNYTVTSAALRSVCYGNGRFVAVGDSGAIYTSTTGYSWTSATSVDLQAFGATGGVLRGVAFGNGLFMAVGSKWTWTIDTGSVFVSTNGTTWSTKVLNKALDRYNGVTYGNNLFAVVGYHSGDLTTGYSFVTTSANGGTSWNPLSLSPQDGKQLNAVAYADGNLVAGGGLGKVVSSTDAANWAAHPATTAANLTGMTYTGNSFLAVADDGSILQSNPLFLLGVAPSTLSFDNAAIGSASASQTVTISNSGTTNLQISSMYFTGLNAGLFKLSLGTCTSLTPTLAAGASCTVGVSFTPTAFGSVASNLEIISNDFIALKDLPVSGTGVAKLNLTLTGSGSGQVHSSPAPDIACFGGTCGTSYSGSTAVTLTATPDAGSSFTGWSGCDSSYANACYLTTGSSRNLGAEFTRTGCSANADCGAGNYCSKPKGICGAVGSCAPLEPSLTCGSVYLPVCGCDGLSYDNECQAQRAGVPVAYSGACGYSTCNMLFLFAAEGAAICQNTDASNEILYVNQPKTVTLGGGALLKGLVSTEGTVLVEGARFR